MTTGILVRENRNGRSPCTGNAIIGDGGGIALIAGMSRLFPFPKFLLLVCLAITPVPLLFLIRAVQQ